MQKYFLLPLVCICSTHAYPQRSIDSMIQTEKNFANTAMVVSTKEAFIKFIDPSGIVFEKGKPVNGLELYAKSERRPGILSWEPEYMEIASTNDFGYTTGPWKYYTNSVKEKPAATGYFITVWHLTQSGWKFLIDFGITCTKKNGGIKLVKIHTENPKTSNTSESCIDAEQKFISSYAAEGVKVYSSALSSQSRINYAGFLPGTNAEQRKALLDSLPRNINYTVIGSGLSPAHDLGYVYGSAVMNNKQDGYLRIWRKENDGWKIAVEVLHLR